MEIKLITNPVIRYDSLIAEGSEVDKRLSQINFDNLVCTEETVAGIKNLRTTLKKEFEEYEAVRKTIKEGVTAPYKEFEEAYKLNIADKYKSAENKLKLAIDEVDTRRKLDKENQAKTYFDENNTYEFLCYENLGLDIKLSTSDKQIKTEIDNKLEQIKKDLNTIDTFVDNKERVLAKYQASLDLSYSVMEVNKEVEREKAIIEAAKPTDKKTEEVIKLPVEEVVEEVRTLSFTVTAPISKLKALKQYMVANNLEVK